MSMTNREIAEYIDAFKYWCDTNEENGVITLPKFLCDHIIEILDDNKKRPHGEWKHAIVDCYKSGYICPHCNGFAVIDGKSDGYSVTFCPNCGSNNRPKEGDENG